MLRAMAEQPVREFDAVIVGGGIAGLWLLDELARSGRRAVLLERAALGLGQTMWSQGIIHGGVKYTLTGMLNPSAEAIREMPGVWRACLDGRREPDLSGAPLRGSHCFLWQTSSFSSRLGMLGARVGLRVAPVALSRQERPEPLKNCPGVVARLDEQVIDAGAVLRVLAGRHAGRVLHTAGAAVHMSREGEGVRISISRPTAGGGLRELILRAARLILTAGSGNAALRSAMGLQDGRTQVRPLHQVMLRGELPELNGHCVDGSATRATVTSATDLAGRRVWQVGGQIAESGVGMEPPALIDHAKRELAACLPGVRLDGAEWATYRADRAEMRSASGRRPDDATVLSEGPVITAWPTKLALAPRLAEMVVGAMPGTMGGRAAELSIDWPSPPVAIPPWEEPRVWRR